MKITKNEFNQLKSLVDRVEEDNVHTNYSTTTIDYHGIILEVEYNYYKGSAPVMYYPDGSGHPGDPSDVDIISITTDNFTYLLDLLDKRELASTLIQDFYTDLETLILEEEHYENN